MSVRGFTLRLTIPLLLVGVVSCTSAADTSTPATGNDAGNADRPGTDIGGGTGGGPNTGTGGQSPGTGGGAQAATGGANSGGASTNVDGGAGTGGAAGSDAQAGDTPASSSGDGSSADRTDAGSSQNDAAGDGIRAADSGVLADAPAAGDGGGGATTVDVYLLAGQSNMDGRGLVSDLSSAQRKPMDGVLIYYRYLPFSGDSKAFSTSDFTPLVPGFSVAPSYSGSTLPSTTFGPEIGFGSALRQAQPTRSIMLIKGSRGATNLAEHWNPGTKGQSSTQGVCYREFLTTLAKAKDALAKRKDTYAIRGLLWHQGESDVDLGVSQATYATELSTFIRRIREDVGDANLPIVVGEVYDNGMRDNVRAAQRQVATSTAHVGFITADGLSTLDEGTHFDAASQLTLGKRFADAMTTLLQ